VFNYGCVLKQFKKNASDFFKSNVEFMGGLNSFSQNNTNKSKDGVWLWGFVCCIKKHAIAHK
jgi:hypothetical protein